MERCRLCSFSGSEISVMKIFDEEGVLLKLRERILNRLQIVIYEYDFLPKIICRTCYGELEKYESFIEKAHRIQEILLRGIQRNTVVPEKSTVLDKVKLEPRTLEEDYNNDICTEDSIDEIQEVDAMEFVEVNPFIKMECPNDMEVLEDRLLLNKNNDAENSHVISKSSPPRTKTESICLEENVSFDDEHQDGNEMDTGDYHEENYNNSEFDSVDLTFDDDCDDSTNKSQSQSWEKSQPQSWERYEQEYSKFAKWRTERDYGSSCSEDMLLNYFKELSATKAPTTQWAVYSMLKSTLIKKENVNIEKYPELLSMLRNNSKNYLPKPKQTVMFTYKNLEDYYTRASDDEYLFQKVVMIFSMHGATCQELVQLVTDEVKIYRNEDTRQKMFLVTIPKEKTKTKESPRQLLICRPDFFETIKKYRDLRSKKIVTDRFFVRYDRKRKRCINQAVGIHTFSSIPKQIAKFLQLPAPDTYSGHSFKRVIAATNPANAGKRIRRLGSRRTASTEQLPNSSYSPSNDGIKKKLFLCEDNTMSWLTRMSLTSIKNTFSRKNNSLMRPPHLRRPLPITNSNFEPPAV